MSAVQLWWSIAGMSPTGTGSYFYWSNFRIVVENIAYEKVVGIWGRATGTGVWSFYPASYFRTLGSNKELWVAQISTPLDQFVVKYDVSGTTRWDNNNGHDYRLDSAAAQSTDGVGTAVIGPPVLWQDGAYVSGGELHLGISVQNLYYAKHVGIRFTTDGWATVQEALATYTRSYEPEGLPYQPQVESWSLAIPTGVLGAPSIEFAVFFDGAWDNNFGQNYQASTLAAQAIAVLPAAARLAQGDVPAWDDLGQKKITQAAAAARPDGARRPVRRLQN